MEYKNRSIPSAHWWRPARWKRRGNRTHDGSRHRLATPAGRLGSTGPCAISATNYKNWRRAIRRTFSPWKSSSITRWLVSSSSSLIVAGAILSGCGSPNAPLAPSCQTQNTASVSFHNTSASTTQNVLWDGIQTARLTPGRTSSPPLVVVAGIAHRMEFRDTANRVNRGCAVAMPILLRCEDQTFTCSN